MAKVYFICGFIGSGKTTYSKKLAEDIGAYRFSIDEWILPLFGEGLSREELDKYSNSLTALFKKAALDMLKLNVDVIFDYGFWKRADREKLRLWAKEHSVWYQFIYLNVAFEECCLRALQRNSEEDPDNYCFTKEMLQELWSVFEPPEDEECLVVECR